MLQNKQDRYVGESSGVLASAASSMFPDWYSGKIELPAGGLTRVVIEEAAE